MGKRVSFALGAMLSATALGGCHDRQAGPQGEPADAAARAFDGVAGAAGAAGAAAGDDATDLSPLALLPGYGEIYRSTSAGARAKGAGDVVGVKGVNSTLAPTWQDQRGTAQEDVAMGVAVGFERSANVSGYDFRLFTVGHTRGALDGNVHGGGFQKADLFLARHEIDGTHRWTRQLGGLQDDFATDVAVQCNLVPDPMPSCAAVHVAGYSAGAFDGNATAGGVDAILVKYDLNGAKLWSRQLGSAQADHAWGVASDSAGNTFVVGNTGGILPGATRAGATDAFIAKYDAAGTRL
jgi:Beta-propeller repeat